jgi:aspartate-semialdehyde dehydrogenase
MHDSQGHGERNGYNATFCRRSLSFMSPKTTIAVLGATGAVGKDLIGLLGEARFPIDEVRLLASERSVGRTVPFGDREVEVRAVHPEAFDGVDLAFFSAGAERSRKWAPAAVEAGATVVDNSSAFRMDPGVPLVVPEINAGALDGHRGIVANPNCTTIVSLMALAPLHRAAGLVRVRAASYQAVSGAGARAMRELLDQTGAALEGAQGPTSPGGPAAGVFPHPIAFNVIPHCGRFLEDGGTEEERKLRDESRKILGVPDLAVSATCVRVPVLRAHCVALWAETKEALGADRAREVLGESPGVKVVDDPGSLAYPMPVSAAGRAPVLVGRVRVDETCRNGIAMFVAGDQILKGAALNAVQIAEVLIREGQLRWPR